MKQSLDEIFKAAKKISDHTVRGNTNVVYLSRSSLKSIFGGDSNTSQETIDLANELMTEQFNSKYYTRERSIVLYISCKVPTEHYYLNDKTVMSGPGHSIDTNSSWVELADFILKEQLRSKLNTCIRSNKCQETNTMDVW